MADETQVAPTSPVVAKGDTFYKVTLPNQKEASFTRVMVQQRIDNLNTQKAQWDLVMAQIDLLEK